MKRLCDCGNSLKTFNWGSLQFRDSVHYHGGRHGSVQADVVVEKEQEVLHLDLQASQERL